jgi:hypothetical protein
MPEGVKVTPKVHEAFGASIVPEHISDTIWKLGGDPGPEVVDPVMVPIETGVPDWFVAVSLWAEVVTPLFPYTDEPKIIVYGVTLSCAYTD